MAVKMSTSICEYTCSCNGVYERKTREYCHLYITSLLNKTFVTYRRKLKRHILKIQLVIKYNISYVKSI